MNKFASLYTLLELSSVSTLVIFYDIWYLSSSYILVSVSVSTSDI